MIHRGAICSSPRLFTFIHAIGSGYADLGQASLINDIKYKINYIKKWIVEKPMEMPLESHARAGAGYTASAGRGPSHGRGGA
jgi:hypothetical protein